MPSLRMSPHDSVRCIELVTAFARQMSRTRKEVFHDNTALCRAGEQGPGRTQLVRECHEALQQGQQLAVGVGDGVPLLQLAVITASVSTSRKTSPQTKRNNDIADNLSLIPIENS